jgi:thiamine pyrophosphate-dependent acetolactate synthase large subunit-like protein
MQGEIFAAEGYSKVTGKTSVCIATSGPGATNLVTGLADAMLDSIPMVAITGQVPRPMIGTDAFQVRGEPHCASERKKWAVRLPMRMERCSVS